MRFSSIHLWLIGLLVFTAGRSLAAPQLLYRDDPVSVTWRDDQTLQLILEVPELETVAVSEEAILVRSALAGGVGNPGEPELPVFVVMVEDYPEGEIALTWEAEGEVMSIDGWVAPHLTHRSIYIDEDIYEREAVRLPDPAIYEAETGWPIQPVSYTTAKMGPRRLLRIALQPVTFYPPQRRSTVPERWVVTVTFGKDVEE